MVKYALKFGYLAWFSKHAESHPAKKMIYVKAISPYHPFFCRLPTLPIFVAC